MEQTTALHPPRLSSEVPAVLQLEITRTKGEIDDLQKWLDLSNVVRAMSARMDELAQEIEQSAAALRGKQDALKVVSNASGEVQAVRERINLVETFNNAKDWENLRSVLRSLIDRVDVRMDGTLIHLAALPSLRKAAECATKLTKLAPLEEIRIKLPRRTRNMLGNTREKVG